MNEDSGMGLATTGAGINGGMNIGMPGANSGMGGGTPITTGGATYNNGNKTSLGREKVPWGQDIWNRIDQAVYNECQRTKVAKKFLPLYGPMPPGKTTINSDTVLIDEGQSLTVDETAYIPLVEIVVDFKLTKQQVEREPDWMTAVTLATRAANLLSQAEDLLIFQGQVAAVGKPRQGNQPAVPAHPLFDQKKVRILSGNAGTGLLGGDLPAAQRVPVNPTGTGTPAKYGENTFAAVADAYSRLQSGDQLAQAHYGPYALVLNYVQYTDTYAPLPTTLIMPADRIKPLVTQGFHGTGTLPSSTGLLVSLGGNTMDLVVGMDTVTTFQQEDPDGRFRFRVYERFALRLKDTSAVIKLEFQQPATP